MLGNQSKHIFKEALFPGFKRGIRKIRRRLKGKVTERKSPSKSKSTLASETNTSLPQWLQDFDLLDWGNYTLADEYLDMVLQFGFVTIFVAAFPLAPFFAFINNIIELRIDAKKMLTHFKRPIGLRAKNIGVWSDIIHGVVKIAVLSNACIIAFSSNVIPKLVYRYFFHDFSHPDYGTLNGYLQNTLTSYSKEDLESPPDPVVRKSNAPFCYFQTYRYGHTSQNKYEFKPEHWQVWLAKVIFVLLYENFVNVIILFVCWAIPDVPTNLHIKMQKEERLINELIVQQEHLRYKRVLSPAHHNHSPNLSLTEDVRMLPNLSQE